MAQMSLSHERALWSPLAVECERTIQMVLQQCQRHDAHLAARGGVATVPDLEVQLLSLSLFAQLVVTGQKVAEWCGRVRMQTEFWYGTGRADAAAAGLAMGGVQAIRSELREMVRAALPIVERLADAEARNLATLGPQQRQSHAARQACAVLQHVSSMVATSDDGAAAAAAAAAASLSVAPEATAAAFALLLAAMSQASLQTPTAAAPAGSSPSPTATSAPSPGGGPAASAGSAAGPGGFPPAGAIPLDPREVIVPTLVSLLRDLKREATPEQHRQALATLLKIVSNVAAHPHEPKYRSLRLSNPVLAAKIGALPAAKAWLRVVGFTPHQPDTNTHEGAEAGSTTPTSPAGVTAPADALVSPSADAAATGSVASSEAAPAAGAAESEAASAAPAPSSSPAVSSLPLAAEWLKLEASAAAWDVLSVARALLEAAISEDALGDGALALGTQADVTPQVRGQVMQRRLAAWLLRCEERDRSLASSSSISRSGYVRVSQDKMGMLGDESPRSIHGLYTDHLQSKPTIVLITKLMANGACAAVIMQNLTAGFDPGSLLPMVRMAMLEGMQVEFSLYTRRSDSTRRQSAQMVEHVLRPLQREHGEYKVRVEEHTLANNEEAMTIDRDGSNVRFCTQAAVRRDLLILDHPQQALKDATSVLHSYLPHDASLRVSVSVFSVLRWMPPADHDIVLTPRTAAVLRTQQLHAEQPLLLLDQAYKRVAGEGLMPAMLQVVRSERDFEHFIASMVQATCYQHMLTTYETREQREAYCKRTLATDVQTICKGLVERANSGRPFALSSADSIAFAAALLALAPIDPGADRAALQRALAATPLSVLQDADMWFPLHMLMDSVEARHPSGRTVRHE